VGEATHLRSVEIQVKRLDCSSTTVEITVTAYTNYFNTNVLFGGETSELSFGDGTSQAIPESDYEILDADLHVAVTRYTIVHAYSGFGYYTVSYRESNRNTGILNFGGSPAAQFYTETAFLLEKDICNSSPTLFLAPMDRACSGVAFLHNPGAIDLDGDSLSYELFIPMKAKGESVDNYASPKSPEFYTSASYSEANEAGDGEPSISIDPVTGTLTWDAPGSAGEYGVAFKVKEWRYNSKTQTRYEIGFVIRDMQIIVEECNNKKPQLDLPLEICVIAGTTVQLNIPATDPDLDNVVIEAASEIFFLPGSHATIEPSGPIAQSTNPPYDTASVKIIWKTSCENARTQPYKIVLKISDRPPSGPRLVRFYTVYITVTAPAPEYESVSINPVNKTVTLKWNDYACENVKAFQVWRRISEYRYDPPECNTGMPTFLRYQLIAELPGTEFMYTDAGLSYASQYCYRILARLGDGTLASRISLDTCLIPKPAEAPIITNVSVESTHPQSGIILVRWTKPFDIDPIQYPPPYMYKVFRRDESDPQSAFQTITVNAAADTALADTQLNTEGHIYRYAIELYVPALSNSPVDTSSAASSAFATTRAAMDGITLQWSANTPWYNYTQKYPYHLIYRSSLPTGPFELIDSVDVNVWGFNYTDRGKYRDEPLTGEVYYYKVKTRGAYGNAAIPSPLENFSQVTPGQILDTVPPCVARPSIKAVNCSEFACDGSDYHITLEWQTECADDIAKYELLVRDNSNDSFTVLATVSETGFIHKNLMSLNKCYRVISIDRAGNRSDTSTVVCSANCTNFKLPNVITPDARDERNDYLTTYPSDDVHKTDCPRSVELVELEIYSRWGDEVYRTTASGESPVLWDGRNSHGQEVGSGTYFYHAKVVFDTNDPSQQTQQIKGWVYVIR
jgi:hypothetical protein